MTAAPEPTDQGSTDDLHDVIIRGVPVALLQRASEHSSDLLREFKLIVAVGGAPDNEVPARLLHIMRTINERFGLFQNQHDLGLQEGLNRGEETADITFEVPVEIGEIADELRRQFVAADDYCRTGNVLLTLASDPDVVRVRNWYLGEFSRQLSGKPPMSWSEYSASRLSRH